MAKTTVTATSTNFFKVFSATTLNSLVSRMKTRNFFIGTILLVSFSSVFVIFRNSSSIFNNKDLSAFTVLAQKGSLPGLVTASGELLAERSVNVSPDRQGILADIFVDEGDLVKSGDVIAQMRKGDFRYRLEELTAEYETNKLAFERRNALFEEGAISAEENEDYKNRFLVSKARLKQRQVEGEELTVRAPFDGVITARYAEPGAYVTPTTRASSTAGSTSSSIVELSQGLEVSAKVPESDIGRIRLNQDAVIRVDAFPDKSFIAKVKEISPRAERSDNVTSFDVTLSLDNLDNLLRIGMTVDVDFQTGSSAESILVPTVAIVTENGLPGLLIVGPKQQPTFKSIELGNSSGSQTAILSGIKPGDMVFIDLPPWSNRRSN